MKTTHALLPLSAILFATASAMAQQVTHIPAADRPLAGAPVQQFSIGAEDGEEWELLSRVSQVAFDAGENLYILDGGNSRVLVFDARGKFVRKIGKKGGGPGELMTPVGLAITKDGFVAVTDLGRPGISLFKPDGSFVKNLMMGDSLGFPTPVGGTQAHPRAGVIVRSNPILFANNIRPGAGGGIPAVPNTPRQSPFTWLTADGGTKKLYNLTLPSLAPSVTQSGSGGRQNMMVRVSQPAFTPPILWGVLSDGSMAVADQAAYRIDIAQNGKVVRSIVRDLPTRKATERDKNLARAQRRKAMKSGIGGVAVTRMVGPGGGGSTNISTGGGMPRISDADIEQSIQEMTFLDLVPSLQRMAVDSHGRLWIEREGKEYGTDGPVDIIDAAGRYVGTVNDKLPDAVSPSGRAAYITKDDMDVEKVVVKKLPPAWF